MDTPHILLEEKEVLKAYLDEPDNLRVITLDYKTLNELEKELSILLERLIQLLPSFYKESTKIEFLGD